MFDGQANFWYYHFCTNDWVDTGCSTDRTQAVEVKHFLTWSSGLLSTFQRANHLGFVIPLIYIYIYIYFFFFFFFNFGRYCRACSSSYDLTCGDIVTALACDLVWYFL